MTFADLFNCKTCRHWYAREHEGPWGDCKHCYWGIAIDQKAAIPEVTIAVMMAQVLEELIAA